MNRLWAFLRNLGQRDRVERDLAAEVDGYLELLVAEKMSEGMGAKEARRAARLELGSRDQVKEEVRDVRAGAWADHLGRDLRLGLRGLRRNPAFSLFATLTFAVAIGGITTIASLVDALLIRPLPYPESDRLAVVLEARPDDPGAGSAVALPNFQDWEARNKVFERMALYEYLGFNLSGDGEPEQVRGLRTSAGLFGVLRGTPLLGRTLGVDDDRGVTGRVVVLSYQLWARRYGADSSIVGRSIRINKEPATVVGVMPRSFSFPRPREQLWVPLSPRNEDLERGAHSFFAIARLRDGVSMADARKELRIIGDQLAKEYPAVNTGETANVSPLRDLWLFEVARTLRILMVAVVLVGVIATANVASLLVARGIARRRELAARLALGATRGRIAAQLIAEAVVLAGAGAVAGSMLASFGIPVLRELTPVLGSVPFRDLSTLGTDWRVFAVAAGVALLIGVGAGVIPALAVIPRSPGTVLKEGESRGGTARTGRRLRNVLVSMEVALAMVVLAGATLLVMSISRQLDVQPGLDPSHVAIFDLSLPQEDFYGPPTRVDLCPRLIERVGAVPGVVAVSAVSHVPLSGASASRTFVVEGESDPGLRNTPSGSYGVVCPGYFATMTIPLVEGRDFLPTDRADSPPVAIINQETATRHFGSSSAVGRRIKFGYYDVDGPWVTVIGVVGNVHHDGLSFAGPRYVYRPYGQLVWPSLAVVVRASGDPLQLASPVHGAIAQVVPEEPIGEPVAMAEIVERSLGPTRFPMVMFSLFAIIAVLLAAIGIFGVASQSVMQRTRELGIRRAVGASESSLYRLVIGQSLTPVAVGIVVGVIAGLLSTGVLRSFLFGVEPTNPATFAVAAAGLGAIAVIAALVPARRAARIDPIVALRDA